MLQLGLRVLAVVEQGADGSCKRLKIDEVLSVEGLEVVEGGLDAGELALKAVLELNYDRLLLVKGVKCTLPVLQGQVGLAVRVQLTVELLQ